VIYQEVKLKNTNCVYMEPTFDGMGMHSCNSIKISDFWFFPTSLDGARVLPVFLFS